MEILLPIFLFIILPPVIFGTLTGLLLWLVWLIQKRFGHEPSKLNIVAIIVIGLFSFTVPVILFAHAIIEFDYVISIPSSPIAAEKHLHQDDAISEAFWRSILPPVLQQPCNNKPVLVCELGDSFSLKLWDTHITFDDLPLLAGIISALTSISIIIYEDTIYQKRTLTDVIYKMIDSLLPNSKENSNMINMLREKGDIESLLTIMRKKNDWLLCLEAAEALAQLGNEQGIHYLVSSLESPNGDIRDVANEILEELKERQSNPLP